jgi:hypothetical protein
LNAWAADPGGEAGILGIGGFLFFLIKVFSGKYYGEE